MHLGSTFNKNFCVHFMLKLKTFVSFRYRVFLIKNLLGSLLGCEMDYSVSDIVHKRPRSKRYLATAHWEDCDNNEHKTFISQGC